MAKLKQPNVKPPSNNPQGIQDIQDQYLRGSNRGGRVQEIDNFTSRNYIPGQQGFAFGPDFMEVIMGNLKINSATPEISMKDNSGAGGSEKIRFFLGNV